MSWQIKTFSDIAEAKNCVYLPKKRFDVLEAPDLFNVTVASARQRYPKTCYASICKYPDQISWSLFQIDGNLRVELTRESPFAPELVGFVIAVIDWSRCFANTRATESKVWRHNGKTMRI